MHQTKSFSHSLMRGNNNTIGSDILNARVLTTVDHISRGDWSRCCGETCEGYDYYRLLEHAGLHQFVFGYVTVTFAEQIVAIAPLFIGDLDLLIGSGVRIKAFIASLRRYFPRSLIATTVFCGSPFGEQGMVAVDPAHYELRGAIINLVAAAMDHICQQQGCHLCLFKDFGSEDEDWMGSLTQHCGYFKGESFPNVRLELPFTSMDEYFSSLSYERRKELRRKIRRANSDGKLRVIETKKIDDHLIDVYRLYNQTRLAGTVGFEILTQEYFHGVMQYLAEHAVYFLYFIDHRLVCFNLCLEDGEGLIDKFIGLDYSVSRTRNLYHYSWCHNVAWCIQRKLKYYQLGQTDHEIKRDLGGRLRPLHYYAKHRNPIFHQFMKIASSGLGPHA